MSSVSSVGIPALVACQSRARTQSHVHAPEASSPARRHGGDASVAGAEQDASRPRSAPVLRADRFALASTDRFAPFPCAERSETPIAHELAMQWNERAHLAADEAHAERQRDLLARTLALADDVDSVEIIRASGPSMMGVAGDRLRVSPLVLARAGTPCSGASDAAVCLQTVEAKRAEMFADVPCEGEVCAEYDFAYALTTRGDHVAAFVGPTQLTKVLGAIDTPVEAWIMLAARQHAYGVSCDDPVYAQQRAVPSGFELTTRMYTSRCKPLLQEDLTFRVDREGSVKVVQRKDVSRDPEACVVSGRRPPALAMPARLHGADSAGALFARMAHLEAASVAAFHLLGDELRALGAAPTLLERVECARCDEVRHAAIMARWAARHGYQPHPPEIVAPPTRSLFEIARDNLVEGCVRELFGALVVSVQAERADDPGVRAELARIAEDEASHAALAYDLAAWIGPQLSDSERAALARTREDAVTSLARELAEPSDEQRTICGMPSLRESRALWAELGSGILQLEPRA